MSPVSPVRAWWTMAVLSLAYVMSFVDRQVLTLLIDPIRADLKITDTQVSLLTGVAFALLYATTAVPIARYADRYGRKPVILAGVTLWGSMTAACGLAQNFWALFAARMGVGLGEAALTPQGYALSAELFPPAQRNRAMSVFVVGSAIGAGVSLLIGAAALGIVTAAAEHFPLLGILQPWQGVFVLLGVLTLMLIPLIATIVERPRAAQPPPEERKARAALAMIWRNRGAFTPHFVALPLLSLSSYGIAAWLPSHFIRDFGWSASEVGLALGLLLVVTGLIGCAWAAFAADWLYAKGRSNASLWLLLVSTFISLPFLALGMASDDARTGMAWLAAFFVINQGANTLAPAALQAIVPDGIRGEVSALWLMVVNLVGIGLGPTITAVTADYLVGEDSRIGDAIALVGVSCTLAGLLIAAASAKAYTRAVRDPAGLAA